MKVTLITHTPEPEKVIASAAKLCYSSSDIETLMDGLTAEKIETFIKKLTDLGHQSPLEHCTFTFGIEGVSRALSHQLVRHRLASYCITGDTVIKSFCEKHRGCKEWTVEQLYNWQTDAKRKGRLKLINLRSVSEETGILVKNKIKKIYFTGVQPVYMLTTKSGRKIKSTQNHRYYTPTGYKMLSELQVGDRVYANGLPAIANPEYLYKRYIIDNCQRKDLAQEIGCGDSTLGKILKKYNIVKPHSQYPNRQGGGNKSPLTEEHKEKLRQCRLKDKNPSWKFDYDDLTNSGGYMRSNKYIPKTECWGCDSKENLENHHIDKNPKHSTEDNILTLCKSCHEAFHHLNVNTVFSDEIISIEYVGEEKTYDIEVVNNPHNFVANGIAIHNSQKSQRYVKEGQFEYITPKSIEEDDMLYLEYINLMHSIQDFYNSAIKRDIPAEDARFVLPNACETKLIVTMNIRSLLHFFEERCCNRAQWEIRQMANMMLDICKEVAPNIFAKAGASCVRGKCKEGKMSCGQPIGGK